MIISRDNYLDTRRPGAATLRSATCPRLTSRQRLFLDAVAQSTTPTLYG